MNTYIEMMKQTKCNEDAMAILRKIRVDIEDKEEMKKVMKETENYYFTYLKRICTKKEYKIIKSIVDRYIYMQNMYN